ncbi:MAG: hypothetical protein ACOC05_05665 [Oceanicaulis sp.]
MGVIDALASLALAAAPPAAGPVEVRLEARETGVAARYLFAEPADTLRLAAPVSEAHDRVTLDGAPARLTQGEAQCGRDCRFAEAELLRYAPSPGGYPEIVQAGACGLWADVSAFTPLDPVTGEALTTRLTVGEHAVELTGEAPQYVALRAPERGPACADAPFMAEDLLAANAARMASDYGLIFGGLAAGATQVVAAGEDALGVALGRGRGGVRGAAAGDDLIFLFADPDAPPAASRVLAVLSHEIAHLWIGRRARLHPQFEQAWITEGAAEYLSLKQLLRIEAAREADVLSELSRHLNHCLSALETGRLLLNGSTRSGAFPYNCGTLAAFYADAAAQAAGSSFEAAMADIVADPAFRSARSSGLDYLAVLGAHMGAQAEREFSELILAPVDDKPARVAGLLARAGLGATGDAGGRGPSQTYLKTVLARHALALLCPVEAGGFRLDEGIVLELDRACDGPDGTSVLSAVNGVDPAVRPQAALDVIAAGCNTGAPTRLRLSGQTLSASCTRPPPDYFGGFTLNEPRALEILSAAP